MDCYIDSDPRILRCHPHEAICLSLYLFLTRRAQLDRSPGLLKTDRIDTHYLSRLLFTPESEIRIALLKLVQNELIMLLRYGVTVTVTAVTDAVTLAVGSDTVQICGWEITKPSLAKTQAERSRSYRERRRDRETRQQSGDVSGDPDTTERVTRSSRDATSGATLRHANRIEENRSDPGSVSFVPTAADLSISGTDVQDTAIERPSVNLRQAKKDAQRARVDRIPALAWRYADRLRLMVLRRNPEANCGSRPWDGKRRPHDVYSQEPADPLEKCGNRLKWAETIRKIVQIDNKPFEQIKRTILWLENEQPSALGSGFIVESADTLRDKWGAIWMMINGKQPKGRGAEDVRRTLDTLEKEIADRAATNIPLVTAQPVLFDQDDEYESP